jgi:catechol 2,3-dioxygenase
MDSTDAAMPASAHVGRVGLAVNDLDAMVQFYADVVGLHVRSRDDDSATLGAGGDPLLVLRADPDAPERGREEAGLFHTAFRLPARAALGDALNRVQDRWQLSGASNHLVSEALYLSDPEGNGVEIYWDRPREEWPVTDEGRVGMDTLPLELDGLRAVAAGDDAVPPDTDVGHVHLEVTNLGGGPASSMSTGWDSASVRRSATPRCSSPRASTTTTSGSTPGTAGPGPRQPIAGDSTGSNSSSRTRQRSTPSGLG